MFTYAKIDGTHGYTVIERDGNVLGTLIKSGNVWVPRKPGETDVRNRYGYNTRDSASWALYRAATGDDSLLTVNWRAR